MKEHKEKPNSGFYQETGQAQRGITQAKTILSTRIALKRAIDYLITHDNCSPQEASRRIQQEARAKKAGLGEVARAIVAEQAVDYRYHIPIQNTRQV